MTKRNAIHRAAEELHRYFRNQNLLYPAFSEYENGVLSLEKGRITLDTEHRILQCKELEVLEHISEYVSKAEIERAVKRLRRRCLEREEAERAARQGKIL